MTLENIHRLLASSLLCLLFCMPAEAQLRDTQTEYNVDSTLYAYYIRCRSEVASPIVLQMTDTLFEMSKQKRDERMQAVALSTKMDYYYFKNNKDSLIYWVEVVKEFARKTNQPKYYYFAWCKRLVNYHIKRRQYNTALYEAQKMMQEAEVKEDAIGIANAYDILSSVYLLKKMPRLSADNLEKSIEIKLNRDLDKFNIGSSYGLLSSLYCQLNEPEKAYEQMLKSKEYIYTSLHNYSYHTKFAQYYLYVKNHAKALEELQKAKEVAENSKDVKNLQSEYFAVLSDYYLGMKDYKTALAIQDSITLIKGSKNEFSPNRSLILGDIYQKLGQLDKSIDLYKEYIDLSDSLRLADEGIATSEFAAMLGLERLNLEKIELQQQMQQRDLTIKQYIIIALIGLLVVGILVFYRERLLNKRLRASKDQLLANNLELTRSQEELCIAKERAEDASRMKTEFIQNMSHEIRTPLNSIVGFSQILSSYFSDDEETREFANIIEQGSTNLLHLVNNVLDLSSLDNNEEIPIQTVVDVTSICQTCSNQIAEHLKPNVAFRFVPERENFYMQANPDRLVQILMNLLYNATKFTTEGEIRLSYRINEERKLIMFNVKDTGLGIPEDQREFVFERFSKIDTFALGTGLGLPISRLIAQKMGGKLILDPNYSAGCNFILTLPIID